MRPDHAIKVFVKVNDQDIPFRMKVGDTGEAFFVFQTDQDVPDHLQTSPLQAAITDADASELAEEVGRLATCACVCSDEWLSSRSRYHWAHRFQISRAQQIKHRPTS